METIINDNIIIDYLESIKNKLTKEEYRFLFININYEQYVNYIDYLNNILINTVNNTNIKLELLDSNDYYLCLLIIQSIEYVNYSNDTILNSIKIFNKLVFNNNLLDNNQIRIFLNFYYFTRPLINNTYIFNSNLHDMNLLYFRYIGNNNNINNIEISKLLKLKNPKLNFKRNNNIYTKILLKN